MTEISYYGIEVTKIVTVVIFECILNVTLLFEYRKPGEMFRARKYSVIPRAQLILVT